MEQAKGLVERLENVLIAEVVRSPLERCAHTVAPLVTARGLVETVEDDLVEVDYGSWTNRPIRELLDEPLWKIVQSQPSATIFPDGEGLAQVQHRSVAAIRAHDRRITEKYGDDAIWLACSHGDVIKSILADALGMHLDLFQRIVVDPCSISVIRFLPGRTMVLRQNDNGGDLTSIVPKAAPVDSATAIGGSTGS